MPFYTVQPRPILIEADNPTEAAMIAYLGFKDSTPRGYRVTGPDTEAHDITLDADQQDEAITIEFARRAKGN